MKKIFSSTLVFLLITVAFVCSSCAQTEVTAGSSSTPESSSAQSTETTPELSDEEAWATDLFEGALEAIEAEADYVFEPGIKLPFPNGFDQDRNRVPRFANQAACDKYFASPVTIPPDSKVISACWTSKGTVVPLTRTGKDASSPLYTQSISDSQKGAVSPTRFADTTDECDYFLVYGGFETGRNKGFYGGEIDRVSITTLVFVIDARQGTLLHIESLGTSSPGVSTQTPTGTTKVSEAYQYMASLLV